MNEELNKIYEVIANKELSRWCIIKTAFWDYESLVTDKHFIKIIPYTETLIELNWQEEIIWHLVMIWDVLSYMAEKTIWFDYYTIDVLNLWKSKRLPIEKQPVGCIIYIYNLINKWETIMK